MFPTVFTNDNGYYVGNHNGVTFMTDLSAKKIIELVKQEGIAKFLTPHVEKVVDINDKWYNDNRIKGVPVYVQNAACCSFTKHPEKWYFFPINPRDLTNVGLVEDDLVEWIKFLNDMRVGFKYLYFGLQEGNVKTNQFFTNNPRNLDNKYYWVAVPKSASGAFRDIPYLHWIMLRYLINTTVTSNSIYNEKASLLPKLAYHNIPRITMMFNKQYGLSKLKSLLYAHVASPFYNYYGLCYSDHFDTDTRRIDLNITLEEFKILWKNKSPDGFMNSKFCPLNTNAKELIGRELIAPYNYVKVLTLFHNKDYEGMIKHIASSYVKKPRILKKKNEKKKVANS